MLEKELKRIKQNQENQRKFRQRRKKKFAALDEDIKKKLGMQPEVGRPPVTDDNILIQSITDIALAGSAADDRRRSEIIRTIKSLDDLHEYLQKELGVSVSRSALYLRLLPKDSTTTEGKRHVTTAPVKLARPDNNLHKAHPDSLFAKATLNNLEEIASILGPEEVTLHSQDVKCRVAIGLTAAKKQAPLLMHMEYRVTLPDHDFVVAKSHKLIPSVIAAVEIKKECFTTPGVTYSGPTYISIWSAKHSSSTALSHLQDMKRVRQLPQFHDNMYTSNDLVKPIMIITCDGGPDENPRYQKTISCAIDYFCSYDLDTLFIGINAPGRSSFNRVERRMDPLSDDLAGIILLHDHHGNHLDDQGKTIDVELEQKNFAHAGSILAEIWSKTVID